MLTDKLKLNDDKTEFMLIGSIDVAPVTVARNLGTWFDSNLNLQGKIHRDRAFSSAAPNLWNNLPLDIRLVDNFERFKSLFITHLFRLAFDM
ncbi:unnamed protein product [Porites lobata]|uniref:Uncharacterized protein n=1 Tax=Porites lobata TaxID=104759 RepID=A0ABN8N1R2_9CNID|nr:unnamed protein product [Porites lobata]